MTMSSSTKRQIFSSLGVFFLWTISSFLCHFFGKKYLQETKNSHAEFSEPYIGKEGSKVITAVGLTAVQIVFCYLFVKTPDGGSPSNLAVARATHILATLFTNISMAFMFASSTFSIKLMEPITSALVQYLLLGTMLSVTTISSLPVIVGGAIAFAGNPLSDKHLTAGVLTALASNVVLAFRNNAIKKNRSEFSQGIQLVHPGAQVISFSLVCTCGFLFMAQFGVLSTKVSIGIVYGIISSIFHVTYSYVSTGVVLQQMTVVSHAVANILKRVLVVLCLYAAGKRQATPANFFGLVVCTMGLLLYAWEKRRQEQSAKLLGDSNDSSVEKRSPWWKYILILSISIPSCLFILSKHETVGVVFKKATNISSSEKAGNRFDHTFTVNSNKKLDEMQLLPDLRENYLAPHAEEINEFLEEDLYENPTRSNFLSKQLRTSLEVIKEAQRLHYDVIGKALKKYKCALLLDIAAFENKGDTCITAGEIYFLARMHLEVVYHGSSGACTPDNLRKIKDKFSHLSPKDLVVLVHGGGNIIGYGWHDIIRFNILEIFKGYQMFVFPQSIWVKDINDPHVKKCTEHYCCNENITFIMRDHQSYNYAKQLFNGTSKIILAPDIAFQIGPVDRFLSPVFDVMWIRRGDEEKVGYKEIPTTSPEYRIHVSDWYKWITPGGETSLDTAFQMCSNGFLYLQRGRVIVTDRLHGHILATLMNIPHVLIDNQYKKISSYHTSWTASVENTAITDDPNKALDLAIELLKKYNSTLPPRVPFIHLHEFFGEVDFSGNKVTYS